MEKPLLLETRESLQSWISQAKTQPSKPQRFSQVLMVTPDFFRIEYAINPYMKSEDGSLKQVRASEALREWNLLRATYGKLGYATPALDGHPELPDMVFAANQSFPFTHPGTGRKSVVLSQMHSNFRKPEVPIFERWYASQGYDVLKLSRPEWDFEGNGDAFFHPTLPLILGGYGYRTQKEVYSELSSLTGAAVLPLELESENFYHLDTCLVLLNEKTAAYQPSAFTESGRLLLQTLFPDLIELDLRECLEAFAGNAHCPNGKDVILQSGANRFSSALIQREFIVHEVETAEFMKAGGSTFCLKMMTC